MVRAILISLALVVSFSSELKAQGIPCSPLSITLNSQAEVDNFQNNNGPCEWLQFLTIQGADIVSLEGLKDLRRIDFNLLVGSTSISSLAGLHNLEIVLGEFSISRNAGLVSLEGFPSALSHLGGLGIGNNDTLVDITALRNLTWVGHLGISDNPVLSSFSGLEQVTEAETVDIYYNQSLTEIEGLAGLQRIGDSLFVGSNELLLNMDGFSGLTSIGSINIQSNASLISIDGFSGINSLGSLMVVSNDALETLDGPSELTMVENLSIGSNASLKNVNGLSNLKSVGHNLSVSFNPSLKDLNGLTNLESVGFKLDVWGNDTLSNIEGLSSVQGAGELFVADNPNLANCEALVVLLDPFDDFAPGPGPGVAGIPDIGGDVTLRGNSSRCNSIDSILGIIFKDSFEDHSN